VSLPATGEYAAYTEYDLDAPVGRLTVPATSSSVVTPGSDAVMCLSCHVAHASNYPDMLRWDYDAMIAGNAGAAAGTGCFSCHTTKD
jgi:predicted CXXCH cytochrome family protein